MNQKRIHALLGIMALVGCHENVENLRTYTAVIESVRASSPMVVEEYSIARGREPATFLTLRLLSGGSRLDEDRVTVVVLGLGDSDKFGKPGETVSFSAVSLLMQSGPISIGRLANYRVVQASSIGEIPNLRHGDDSTAGPGRH